LSKCEQLTRCATSAIAESLSRLGARQHSDLPNQTHKASQIVNSSNPCFQLQTVVLIPDKFEVVLRLVQFHQENHLTHKSDQVTDDNSVSNIDDTAEPKSRSNGWRRLAVVMQDA
jgi:hypothetical protein